MIFVRHIALWVFVLFHNAAAGQEVDLCGTWELSYRMPDRKEVIQVHITSADTRLLATSAIGEFAISLDDTQVTWSHPLAFRRGAELAMFSGELRSADFLKGVYVVQKGAYQGRAIKWEALRIPTPD